MRKIRIGKDIDLRWHIEVPEGSTPLSDMDLTLYMNGPQGMHVLIENATIGVDTIEFTLSGTLFSQLGDYSLTCWKNKGAQGQTVLDAVRAFTLVKSSEQEADYHECRCNNLELATVDLRTELQIDFLGCFNDPEIVARIESLENRIGNYEVVNNLDTLAPDQPLSAEQGAMLKSMVSLKQGTLSEMTEQDLEAGESTEAKIVSAKTLRKFFESREEEPTDIHMAVVSNSGEITLATRTVDVNETKTVDGQGLGVQILYPFHYPIPSGATVNIPAQTYNYCVVYVNDAIHVRNINGTPVQGTWGEFTAEEEISSIKYESYANCPLNISVQYQEEVPVIVSDIEDLKEDVGDTAELATTTRNLVSAINECHATLPATTKVDTIDVDHSSVGTTATTVTLEHPIKSGDTYTITENVEGQFIKVEVINGLGQKTLVCSKLNGVYAQGKETGNKVAPYDIVQIEYQCYSTITIKHQIDKFVYETLNEQTNAKIGTLSELQTETKTNLVAATNEIVNALPEMESVQQYIAYNFISDFNGKTITLDKHIKAGEKFWIVQNADQYNVYTAVYNDDTEAVILRVINGSPNLGAWGEQTAAGEIKAFIINSYATARHTIYRYVRQLKLGEEVLQKAPNRWHGKKWLLVGDSISTEGSAYATYGYGTIISESLGLLKTNVAISGKRLSEMLTEQLTPASRDYDLITIMGGTNDAGYHVGTSVTRQSVIDIIEYIRANYPRVVFMFITPIRRYDVDSGGASDKRTETKQYVDVIKEVCEEYCVPYCDLWNAIEPAIDEQRYKYFVGTHTASSSDGTHPNNRGHELFLAPLIEKKLLEIAPYYFNDYTQV